MSPSWHTAQPSVSGVRSAKGTEAAAQTHLELPVQLVELPLQLGAELSHGVVGASKRRGTAVARRGPCSTTSGTEPKPAKVGNEGGTLDPARRSAGALHAGVHANPWCSLGRACDVVLSLFVGGLTGGI